MCQLLFVSASYIYLEDEVKSFEQFLKLVYFLSIELIFVIVKNGLQKKIKVIFILRPSIYLKK